VTVDCLVGKGALQRAAARQAMDIGFVHQNHRRVAISRVTVEAEALKRVKSRRKTCTNSFHGSGDRLDNESNNLNPTHVLSISSVRFQLVH
jgi:hypothetical protein